MWFKRTCNITHWADLIIMINLGQRGHVLTKLAFNVRKKSTIRNTRVSLFLITVIISGNSIKWHVDRVQAGYVQTNHGRYFIEPMNEVKPELDGQHVHIAYKRDAPHENQTNGKEDSTKGHCGTKGSFIWGTLFLYFDLIFFFNFIL